MSVMMPEPEPADIARVVNDEQRGQWGQAEHVIPDKENNSD